MNLVIFILASVSIVFGFPGQDDEVIILPGLQFQPTFKHYSGYLNGSDTRKLHYWFVESQKSPSNDPLVLWLNGGPGCSSLDGFLTEHGPFRVTPTGYLLNNPYSWNKIANVIYLESPACVGFSYSTDGSCDANDDSTSLLNLNALKHFFIKFPQFKNRDFFITGESYGGYYVPTLSERIALSPSSLPVNFKGIAVGNGYSSVSINNNGNFYFAYNHGLISDSLWREILAVCCNGQTFKYCDIMGNQNHSCQLKVKRAMHGFGPLNPFNIYSQCPEFSSSKNEKIWTQLDVHSNYEKSQILFGWHSKSQQRISKLREQYKILKITENYWEADKYKFEIPCTDDRVLTNYLNNPRVRYALNIPVNVQEWSVCSVTVNLNYLKLYENMTRQYQNLFKLKDFRIWIYNGDMDMMCSYLADEWFFESLNQKVSSCRKPWFYIDSNKSVQIGGFVKTWESFVLLTVLGSGHMVPTDKPQPAYHMFQSFINGYYL